MKRLAALMPYCIAVEAGGVSWINTGTSATRFDGHGYGARFGAAQFRRAEEFHDGYGISVTSELLSYWAGKLGASLSNRPMPDFLIEALSAVREAGMIDHRNVHFYDARPVTPRVAIALEDHAVESVASLASMSPEQLIASLTEDEVDYQFDQLVLKAVLAPLNRNGQSPEVAKEAKALEASVGRFDSGGNRVVSFESVWEVRHRLSKMPVPPAVRFTLERGLAMISSAEEETAGIERVQQSIEVIRTRHRRIRNAITHGNPVSSTAIESVRGFSERLARQALNIALYSYATGESIADVLAHRRAAREKTRKAMIRGRSILGRIRTANAAETSVSEARNERSESATN